LRYNNKSRDAIVVLDSDLEVFGTPCRGNIKNILLRSETIDNFVQYIFDESEINHKYNPKTDCCCIAIDTPLAFPKPFINLVSYKKAYEHEKYFDQSHSNPYLFRKV